MEEIAKNLLATFWGFGQSLCGFFVLKSKGYSQKGSPSLESRSTAVESLRLSSDKFENNQMIPRKYTCDGENMSPPLKIENVPIETQSLALIMHDPDAEVEGGWTHWTVFNMDPGTLEIDEGSVPEGSIQGTTSFGKTGYGGPCPPRIAENDHRRNAGAYPGAHHYEFSIYALDSRLLLDKNAQKSDIEHAMEGHIIDQYTLTGLYRRA